MQPIGTEFKLIQTLENIGVPAVLFDSQGRRRWQNEAYAQQYDQSAMPGFLSILWERDPRQFISIIDALYCGQSWRGELHERADGQHCDVIVSITSAVGQSPAEKLYFALIQDITLLKRQVAETHEQAIRDKLTGLPNRSCFDAMIENWVRHSRRTKHLNALLLIDLDGFKSINDTHGHDAGDRVLIESARRIQSVLRESDFCARLGGDEFAVLIGNLSDMDGVCLVAEKLVTVLCQPICLEGNQLVGIGASVGCAPFRGFGDSPPALFKTADKYLYAAKRSGKNTFRCAHMPVRI